MDNYDSEQFSRTALLLGNDAISNFRNKRVAIFGVGGVGGYVCESLARTGIGILDIIDNDTVNISNLNRQIIATRKTLGMYKVDAMKERILDINPNTIVNTYKCFFLPENADSFPFDKYDYVVDCVDTVTAKIELIMRCKEVNVPIISAMGAGNKLDPSRFKVADIFQTTMCPLARVMRYEMKKRGVKKLKVVYSDEKPINIQNATTSSETNLNANNGNSEENNNKFKKIAPGSISFVPAAAGLVIAGELVKDLYNTFTTL